jgi:hypothetical protein
VLFAANGSKAASQFFAKSDHIEHAIDVFYRLKAIDFTTI